MSLELAFAFNIFVNKDTFKENSMMAKWEGDIEQINIVFYCIDILIN